jgi:hypothetical protein
VDREFELGGQHRGGDIVVDRDDVQRPVVEPDGVTGQIARTEILMPSPSPDLSAEGIGVIDKASRRSSGSSSPRTANPATG